MKPVNDPGHVLFQLANTCLLLSYASKDLLMLRIVLMLAGLFFVLWGGLGTAVILLDTILWNGIFCLINAARAAELIWERRPIQFEREEHEQVYAQVFGPVGIGRLPFKELMEQALLRSLRPGSTFIEAGNEATNLTLLYSGRLEIVSAPKDGRPAIGVGFVQPMQFVESPQWAHIQVQLRKKSKTERMSSSKKRSSSRVMPSQSLTYANEGTSSRNWSLLGSNRKTPVELPENPPPTNDSNRSASPAEEETILEMDTNEELRKASTVDVTFRAVTHVTFFTWPMEKLQDFILRRPMISAPLNSVVGADMATKLFSQSKASGEEKEFIGKRIFLPLDEPAEQEAILVPIEEKESDEDDTPSPQDKPYFSKKPSFDRRNSLMAEKRWLERRGAEDTRCDEQLATLLQCRTSLNKYEISALLSKGRWRRIVREGTVLLREGEMVNFLGIVLEGSFSVHKGEGDKTTQLHKILPTQMVGSLELLEAGREHLSGETVVSLQPCTWICWDCDDLRELLAPRPRLRSQLTMLVAMDLTEKFRQVEDIV